MKFSFCEFNIGIDLNGVDRCAKSSTLHCIVGKKKGLKKKSIQLDTPLRHR